MKLNFATDDGLATRAVFGTIVLETDETIEPEFAQMMALSGVGLYHSRIPMAHNVTKETLAQMEADLPASVRLLPQSLKFDVIGYGCTSASSVIGSDRVAESIQSVHPEAKVTNPLAGLIAAGRSLDLRKLGFVSPYVAEVSQRMRERLEDAGFEISGFASFEEGDDRVVARITPSSIADAVHRVAQASDCDAVIVSCTNMRCLQVIPQIEAELGIPVLSSNQAMGWHMLRLARINDPLPQFGKLFEVELAG